MAAPVSKSDLIAISYTRYKSESYVMKEDRYKCVRPIIIANWEAFDMEGEYIMRKCERIQADANLIEETLKTKFVGVDLEIVKCYNLWREELMTRLKYEAQHIPTKGKNRPDLLLCFIVARGKPTFFYDIRKRAVSEKIFFKEIVDIFNGQNCPGLVLRPKVFFIQTEGKAKQPKSGLFNLEENQSKGPKTTPVEADCFLYASTALTELEEKNPSKFVEFLCGELNSRKDLLHLTLKVNKRMSDHTKDDTHIPMTTSQLTKALII